MATLETLARQFAAANPTRDGSNWSGWCASHIYRFTKATTAYDPATAAYRASRIVSTDPNAAPIGAIHYWLDGGDGHVGIDLRGRGRAVFMASRQIDEAWAPSLGIVSVARYNAKAPGLRYAGWSNQYGANPVRLSADDWGHFGDGPSAPAGNPGRTSTEDDGIPGGVYWRKVQSETKVRGWYGGAVDSVPGPATHKAHARLQAAILNEYARNNRLGRTSTEDDGIPGKVFWTLAQKAGRAYGYAGAIDGVGGPNTEKALYKLTAAWLNRYAR